MKANLIVGEMDPSRIAVACRAVSHELVPRFQDRLGAAHGYWMVNRTTGEVLVLTTWHDEEALAAARASPGALRANVAERIGLGIRAVLVMDVLDADEPGLPSTVGARWARAMWSGAPGSDGRGRLPAARREVVADERPLPGFCGSYVLGDPDSGAELRLTFWDHPVGTADGRPAVGAQGMGSTANRIREFDSLGVAAAARPASPPPPTG